MELICDRCTMECDERFSFEVKRTEVEASSGLGPCALFHQFHIFGYGPGMGQYWVPQSLVNSNNRLKSSKICSPPILIIPSPSETAAVMLWPRAFVDDRWSDQVIDAAKARMLRNVQKTAMGFEATWTGKECAGDHEWRQLFQPPHPCERNRMLLRNIRAFEK